MWMNFKKSPLAKERWDGVVWYSPSIFHGPLVMAIKKTSMCKSYLIIRDIFPDWAVDIGLIRKWGLIHHFFNVVCRFQYSIADVIGVQTHGNTKYFKDWQVRESRRLEILQNWLFDSEVAECSISLASTKLAGRKIFVYAGNMGVAQGADVFLELVDFLSMRLDIGFLFVGRGIDAANLEEKARSRSLSNILFFDEIHPDEIPGLFAQCTAGLIALDPKHNSHNIPGKFLAYMQAGLPVLAKINANNDLVQVIQSNDVGRVSIGESQNPLGPLACELLSLIDSDAKVKGRCRALYLKHYSPGVAVKQIVSALSGWEMGNTPYK
jgi:glycosyltransferase involved in cell wall biosynthesis